MYKLFTSVRKELLLLKRDFGGVIILFLMPLVLIITVTLIQDNAFKKAGNSKIAILLVDNDKGKVAQSVLENLQKSNAFDVITQFNGIALTEKAAKEAVFKGKYQIGIIIPEKLSSGLQAKIDHNVERIVRSLETGDTLRNNADTTADPQKEIK